LILIEFEATWSMTEQRSRLASHANEDTELRNLGGTKAFGGMVENSPHLFVRDARKPLQELGGLRPVFEVLKQSGNRHTGTSENPFAA